ncbi:hypothetical protein SCOCK_40253 [Actinacidiphila cocklensis]|uniref:Transposase IS204/IS1001/IS1096/IS1165 zinc-finger domain-containing protein n=1 Tax=Actinacidiphila cocklensis TaxID=887465 RepID=A0A9W4DUC0_9ACTN|nr:hypothetical protein SCOCK_40253 [Actinacidiphila cocklensis]
MRDVNSLVVTVFSGLSALVVDDVADGGDAVRVVARTRDVPVPCPVCGVPTGKVHGYHVRTVADVPVDSRRVVVRVRVRRLVCPVLGCRRQTFREQIPGLLERLQRRTTRLTSQISQVVKELCGRASAPYRSRMAAQLLAWDDPPLQRWDTISPYVGATALPDHHADLRVAGPAVSLFRGQGRRNIDLAARGSGAAPRKEVDAAAVRRTPSSSSGTARADHPTRHREPTLGLPKSARRTAPPRA